MPRARTPKLHFYSAGATLTVNAPTVPDFSLAASPGSATVTAGSSASYSVTLTGLNGYGSSVALSVGTPPSGAAASFNPTSLTPTSGGASSTLTVSTAAGMAAGTYQLTVTGTGGDPASIAHSATVTLKVNAPAVADFSAAVSPSSASVTVGSNVAYSVTLTALNGYSSSVSLAVSGLPSGASGTFDNPTSVTPTSGGASSALTVSTKLTTPAGSYPLTITATGADQVTTKHTSSATLVVKPLGDFSIGATPASASAFRTQKATYTVNLTGLMATAHPSTCPSMDLGQARRRASARLRHADGRRSQHHPDGEHRHLFAHRHEEPHHHRRGVRRFRAHAHDERIVDGPLT